jgi:hypothetical protein
MANSDYNIIKPVENLQTVGSLTPANKQNEKKRRQNTQQQEQQQPGESGEADRDNKAAKGQPDRPSVDYCA